KSDYDFQVVPNDRLPEAQQKYKDQLRIYTNANTYYYALNNAIPPFNNIKARQAVQYGIDPNAIISGIYGGLGRPTQNFLPPGYPHPLDWFDTLLNGDRITKTHNNNVGNVKVPSVDKEIDALKKITDITPATNARWAKVDRDLMVTYATTVPYMNRSQTDFFGQNIDMSCYVFNVVAYWDFGLSC